MSEWGTTREERAKNIDSHVRAGLARQPHYVYRCYDAEDRLLYVGCTWDVNGRLQIHRSSWNNPASAALNMRMVRHTSEAHPDKAAARKAEREAIYNEAPLLNLHHQKVKLTPTERRIVIEQYLEATRPPINQALVALLENFSAPKPLADTG